MSEASALRPGEKGYAAAWRKALGRAGIARLRNQGQENRRVAGRTILIVLKTYGEHMNNLSGECWPSQELLAMESGTSVSSVARVQEWAREHGWMEVVKGPIPGKRGLHVRLLLGRTPCQPDREKDAETTGQPDGDSPSGSQDSPSALTDELSLGLSPPNSHESQFSVEWLATNAPSFEDEVEDVAVPDDPNEWRAPLGMGTSARGESIYMPVHNLADLLAQAFFTDGEWFARRPAQLNVGGGTWKLEAGEVFPPEVLQVPGYSYAR